MSCGECNIRNYIKPFSPTEEKKSNRHDGYDVVHKEIPLFRCMETAGYNIRLEHGVEAIALSYWGQRDGDSDGVSVTSIWPKSEP